MAEAQIEHFTFDAGDEEPFDLNFDKDISNWTIYVDIGEVISKEITTHDTPADGETSFTLTSSETSDLDGGYSYKMRYEDSSGSPETFLKGVMTWE